MNEKALLVGHDDVRRVDCVASLKSVLQMYKGTFIASWAAPMSRTSRKINEIGVGLIFGRSPNSTTFMLGDLHLCLQSPRVAVGTSYGAGEGQSYLQSRLHLKGDRQL